MNRRILPGVVLMLANVVLITGCGGGNPLTKIDESMEKKLFAFGKAYWNFMDTNKRAPTGWQDFEDFAGSHPEVRNAGYKLNWGVRYPKVGTANFVLAYPPDGLEKGGTVLMLDGNVTYMSAADIKTTMEKQDKPK